jgi:hypothetical protein
MTTTAAIASSSVAACVCAKGYYKSAGSCKVCPSGSTTMQLQETQIEACLCKEGYYMPKDTSGCKVCPAGMTCGMGSAEANYDKLRVDATYGSDGNPKKAFPTIQERHFSSFQNGGPMSVFACASKARCTGGNPVLDPESARAGEKSPCMNGLTKLSCSACAPETSWGGDSCTDCSNVEVSKFLYPTLPCLLFLPIVIGVYLFTADPANTWAGWRKILSSGVFILLNYYQALTLLKRIGLDARVSQDGDDLVLQRVFNAFSFTVEFESLLAPECAGLQDFKSAMVLKSLAPLFMVILCGGLHFGSKALGLINQALVMEPNRHLNAFMTLLFVFFTAIAALCFQLFSCRNNPNGMYTMEMDYGIICYDSDTWQSMLGVAIACVIFYIIGLLSYFVYGFIMASRGQFAADENFRMRWKFLFVKFHPEVGWFAMVYLAKNILINAALSIFSSGYLQVYFTLGTTILYLSSIFVFMPYRHMCANMLEVTVQFIIIVSLCSLNRFADGKDGLSFADNLTTVIAAAVPPIAFLIAIARSYNLKDYACQGEDFEHLCKEFRSLASINGEQAKALLELTPDIDRMAWVSVARALQAELGQKTKSGRLSLTAPVGPEDKSASQGNDNNEKTGAAVPDSTEEVVEMTV